MATDTGLPEALKEFRSLWWLFMLLGVCAVVAGILLIFWTHISLTTLAVIAGIFLLVDGVFAIIGAIASRGAEGRGLLAVVGILSLIAGVVMVKHPFGTLTVFVIIFGAWLLVAGVLRFVAAVAEHEGRGLNIIVGILDVIAGIVVLAWPDLGLKTLAVVAGIVFILRGLAFLYGGWQIRKLPKDGNLGGAAPATA